MELNTIEDIKTMFPDEESVRKHIARIRWGEWAVCPYCGNDKSYLCGGKGVGKRGKYTLYKCASLSCKRGYSVLGKTMMMNTKIDMTTWMEIFFLWVKKRGNISPFDFASEIGITHKTTYFVMDKISFVWGKIDRTGMSTMEIINDIIKRLIIDYDNYVVFNEGSNFNNPLSVRDIDDISKPDQYYKLLKYTKYFITVYAEWIFIDFATPQDILAETFLYMRDNKILEYDTQIVLKTINKVIGIMWRDFLNKHPRHHSKLVKDRRNWKNDAVINLKDNYVVNILTKRKGNTMTWDEIKKDKKLLEKTREEIKEKRKINGDVSDFNSHFD